MLGTLYQMSYAMLFLVYIQNLQLGREPLGPESPLEPTLGLWRVLETTC